MKKTFIDTVHIDGLTLKEFIFLGLKMMQAEIY